MSRFARHCLTWEPLLLRAGDWCGARSCGRLSGLVAGLLHVVGRLYVLARMRGMPHLLDQDGVPEKLTDRWADTVTGVMLLKWEVPREFCEAIERFQQHSVPAPK